ncbi:MAG: DNA translocase FtsK 4TM domain-containing protein [Zymomonas mobilis]|uniref:DNA translocase FtsK n=1 Tax=Zymomonas mobilis TaxID=542 RepID=A0A542W349_ZYMMB|nr:DNA translocase FtsK 4TM domain-containing protein [Zymomonas mobilis]TQL18003.1 DNA translocase FtsK [Zymomonas mobilis]
MATGIISEITGSEWQARMRHVTARSASFIMAVALFAGAAFLFAALMGYNSTDPAFNTAAAGPARNITGDIGAWFSDLLLSFIGLPVLMVLPPMLVIAFRLWRNVQQEHPFRHIAFMILGIMLVSASAGLMNDSQSGLPAGWGGGIGLLTNAVTYKIQSFFSPSFSSAIHGFAFCLCLAGGCAVWLWGLGFDAYEKAILRRVFSGLRFRSKKTEKQKSSAKNNQPASNERIASKEPLFSPSLGGSKEVENIELEEILAEEEKTVEKSDSRPIITTYSPKIDSSDPAKRKTPHEQTNYALPTIDFLQEIPVHSVHAVDHDALERNARLLETVLQDFHVRGQIVEIRPGPVVTMYELEPDAGIKASRVIALADDIARYMSAESARIAVIPGRTVIGIELPNPKRDMVSLRELVGSEVYDNQQGSLPLILGKNIAGDPVITDLAPMPHLLVAGTTGSGKSVGINCMILSLLYRLTPDQCRMIMIDPKMLELSIYDGIPHLLSPVVTEPAKAVRALKWAVEQMEERYRMMASAGVRGLAGFNQKVKEAQARGEPLSRKVQTGYDKVSGQPIYEDETLEYEPLPQIVIVVDELADLMMTAGKEVEYLIQRLAQKARAAGIHLIMATQRPSVDVITGVIKANLPTRISFQVTSKIDSRTILGEQGAEQLLGKGDMLYMPGGKQVLRVHGPFVSDGEVQAVADHWREQGTPEYISSVTEEPADGGYKLEGQPDGDHDPETKRYRDAVQLVVESRKASTSWLQRQLRVGYNNAARLIERMEKEGIVSAADHVGRREVLIQADELVSLL